MVEENIQNIKSETSFKYASPSEAYKKARRRILNNALRRRQHSLDLSNFGLIDLPPEIGQLRSLRSLNISNNQIVNLPAEIGEMAELEMLGASTNKLVNLPDSVGRLQKLERLTLSKNKLRELPKSIGALVALKYLKLDGNNLKSLPQEIGALTGLRTLDLSENELTSLPNEIGSLISLLILNLGSNQISTFPEGITFLSNLRELDFDHNKLSALPAQFERLANLSTLYLNTNRFSEFPNAVIGLSKLSTLMLLSNRIATIPASISRMISLTTLYCDGNLIQELPPEIALLKLEKLSLERNQLTRLPRELGTVRSLEPHVDGVTGEYYGLYLEQNPLPEPYPRLIGLGQPKSTQAILAWLRGELDPERLDLEEEKPPSPVDTPPPEPGEEAGPTFRARNGQIDLVPEVETSAIDQAIQEALHARLQRQIVNLQDATIKVSNQHPQLLTVVDEYARLISQPIHELDVVDVWAVGNALMAQAAAFQRQDVTRTLSEPLEPAHLGLLTTVAGLHGGFILGFPKAAELTLRADRSRVGPNVVQAIGPSTSNVLSALSRQRRLLSERARQLFEALDSALLTGSWDAARIGYTSYATVRNALVAIGRISIWINDKGGSLAGGAIIGSAIATANLPPDTLQLVMLFLRSNSADILSFVAPFPELRIYIEWIINYFDDSDLSSKSSRSISPMAMSAVPSSTYALFRSAILAEQQVICTYDGQSRELSPHIIGTSKDGEEVVLAWQFGGESVGKLPQWRCLKLANVRDARARDGRWHEGGSHKSEQSCVVNIDLDINIHVRKNNRRGDQSR